MVILFCLIGSQHVLHGRRSALRLRDRRADRHRRAVRDGAARAAPPRLPARAVLRVPRRAGAPGAAADAARDDRARAHQLQRPDQLDAGLAGLGGRAPRDRRRLPHLHAAPGDVQRRHRDGALPGPEPLRGAPRLRRPALAHGERDAPDLPAARPGGGRHARAVRADHAPHLPARALRHELDRPGLQRAVLVLVLAALQRA